MANAKFIDGELGDEEDEDSSSDLGQVNVEDTQDEAGEEDLEERGSGGDDQDQVDEEEEDPAYSTSGDDIQGHPSYGGKQLGALANPDITGLDDE